MTRKHGLGGQPGCYAVDLTFRDLAGGGEPQVIGCSGDTFDHPKGPYHYGAFWAGLNDDGVSVYRHADNILDDQCRLRPWQRRYHLYLPLVIHQHLWRTAKTPYSPFLVVRSIDHQLPVDRGTGGSIIL